MPAGKPRPGPPPQAWARVLGRPTMLSARLRPLPRGLGLSPWRPLAPPGAGNGGALANSGQGHDGGGVNANHHRLESPGGKPWPQVPPEFSARAPLAAGLPFLYYARSGTSAPGVSTRSPLCRSTSLQSRALV
jgi:hypothetical protein